ncbi:MAG: ribosome maturation factor RimP, partial [Fusobacterium periodonticum]|nr:ribosome maturation factor RimP [Fusobacterium periodonticum]
VKGDNIVFLIDKKEVEIEFKEIRKANILFEFNDF